MLRIASLENPEIGYAYRNDKVSIDYSSRSGCILGIMNKLTPLPNSKEEVIERAVGNRGYSLFKEKKLTLYSAHLSRLTHSQDCEFWYFDDFVFKVLNGKLTATDIETIRTWSQVYYDHVHWTRYSNNIEYGFMPSFDEFISDLYDMGVGLYYCNTVPKQHECDNVQAVLPRQTKTQIYDETEYFKIKTSESNFTSQKRRI